MTGKLNQKSWFIILTKLAFWLYKLFSIKCKIYISLHFCYLCVNYRTCTSAVCQYNSLRLLTKLLIVTELYYRSLLSCPSLSYVSAAKACWRLPNSLRSPEKAVSGSQVGLTSRCRGEIFQKSSPPSAPTQFLHRSLSTNRNSPLK